MRYVVLLVLLVGCATPEQRAERRDAIIAQMGDACEKMGFPRDSEQHKSCVLDLFKAHMGSAASDAGRAAASATMYNAIQQSRPKTCVPNGYGVTCY